MKTITSNHDPRRHAFTLIELLIVIAVVAVLAAIAFPVYSLVTARSKAAICTSNLRQLGAAFNLYAIDHNGDYAVNPDYTDPTFTPSTPMWMGAVSSYVGQPMFQTPYSGPNIYKCPAFQPKPMWQTYTLNANVYPDAQAPTFYTNHGARLANISHPSHVVVLFDGGDGNVADGFDATGMVNYFVVFRHPGGTANFLMIDGHVEALAKSSAISTDNSYWQPNATPPPGQ